MFIIKPKTKEDRAAALKLLEIYNVCIEERKDGIIVVLSVETHEKDYQLAEMAFQMNFIQDGRLFTCELCINGGIVDPCGHLTFTEVI
jgi:hypothetical protein